MSHGTKPIPEGFHTVTPYLIVEGAAGAIEFYKEAFGAAELLRMEDAESGRIMHAEIQIGDSPVMLADEPTGFPGMRGPRALGGSPVHIFLYVEDADATMDRAISAGAKVLEPAQDYPAEGDRRGGFEDPFGFVWWVATRIEDISREEIQRRYDEQVKS